MKVESRQIVDDELVANVVDALKQYIEQLAEAAGTPYPITAIRVNLNVGDDGEIAGGEVFVTWNDYSEEEQKISEIVSRASELKEALANETDIVKQVQLSTELGELIKQYKELTGMDLTEVI